MIRSLFLSIFAIILFSCKSGTDKSQSSESSEKKSVDARQEIVSFFPLTSFIQGQLAEIKASGVNPLKFTFNEKGKDSVWIKMEELESEFSELIKPTIDSGSMSQYFRESSFMDETLNMVTLTYDPVKPIPEKINWIHWDIYIAPETNSISRVYMVKKLPDNHKKQITLIPGKNCRIITINDEATDVKTAKISDILIKWD